MVVPLLICFAAAAAQPAPPATPASAPGASQAKMIFEKDWVLMNWALKFYDADRDIMLEPNEAQSAAAAFRDMADANHDGRVTTDEYSSARAFILARY
jgi:hypothetical protein